MSKTFLFLFIFLAFVPGVVLSFEIQDWCGFQFDESMKELSQYDYGDSIRAKFIFVGFPKDAINGTMSDTLLYSHLQQAVVDSSKSWLKSHSQGKLQFTSDTGILFRPGSDFSTNSSALS